MKNLFILIHALALTLTYVPRVSAQPIKETKSDFLFIEQGYTPRDSKTTLDTGKAATKKKAPKKRIQYDDNTGQAYYVDQEDYAPAVKSKQQESDQAYRDYLERQDELYYEAQHGGKPRDAAGPFTSEEAQERYIQVSGPRKSAVGGRKTEADPYADTPRTNNTGDYNTRYYRGYYDERRLPGRYYQGRWSPVLLEPVKIAVWSARTAPRDMLIWEPRQSLTLYGSMYDGKGTARSLPQNQRIWTLENFLHYGITDKFEASLVPAFSYTPTDSTKFSFGDLPVHLRYMFSDNANDATFTALMRVVLPTDSADATSNFIHGYGIQITAPRRPLMMHFNMSYNFVSETNGTDPGNYLEYGANFEYYPLGKSFDIMLEMGGIFQGKTEIKGISVADSSASEFHVSPGFGITSAAGTRMQFSYTRTLAGMNSPVNNIFRAALTKKFPKFSQIFY